MTNVYDDAIEILRERGWIQGNFETKDGVCLSKALRIAHGGGWWDMDGYAEAQRMLDLAPDIPGCISIWNDDTSRNVDDVIGRLKLASEKYELEKEADGHH